MLARAGVSRSSSQPERKILGRLRNPRRTSPHPRQYCAASTNLYSWRMAFEYSFIFARGSAEYAQIKVQKNKRFCIGTCAFMSGSHQDHVANALDSAVIDAQSCKRIATKIRAAGLVVVAARVINSVMVPCSQPNIPCSKQRSK